MPCPETAKKRLEPLSGKRSSTLDPTRFGDSHPAPLAALRLLHLSRDASTGTIATTARSICFLCTWPLMVRLIGDAPGTPAHNYRSALYIHGRGYEMPHGFHNVRVRQLVKRAAATFRVNDLALNQIDLDGLRFVAIISVRAHWFMIAVLLFELVYRERALQCERVELSQAIHDTAAQSAYMVGLGIDTAIELANAPDDKGRDELIAKLEAIHALSKSTMWELRHPIDAGPIFEGREFGRVLSSHASTFTTITSIPTEVEQSGREPRLSAVTRGLLFSIAHNAMTNAFRHSRADRVTIALNFEADRLQMSVYDDGIGLPDDYVDRGHGFRNMRRDVERMGGRREVGPGESGRGTSVVSVVPYDANRGGK